MTITARAIGHVPLNYSSMGGANRLPSHRGSPMVCFGKLDKMQCSSENGLYMKEILFTTTEEYHPGLVAVQLSVYILFNYIMIFLASFFLLQIMH